MATVQRASMIQYPDGQVVIHNIRKKRVSIPVFGANESYSATLVNTWYDGTAMDDSKADGSIYFKLKALPSGADSSLEQYVGSYFRLNLPNEGESFLEKDTMQEMRDLNSTEILLLKMGYYKGVKLNGYYDKNDTPSPIEYKITNGVQPDNGGNSIVVGDIILEHTFVNIVDVSYFGAIQGEVSDSFIQACEDYCFGMNLVMDFGSKTYRLAQGINIRCETIENGAVLEVIDSPDVAVTVNANNAVLTSRSFYLPAIKNIGKPTSSYTGVGGGLKVYDLNACKVYVKEVSNFTYGLFMSASPGVGNVYNNIFLGGLINNKDNIICYSEGSLGWVNQNTFYGGRLSKNSSEMGTTGVIRVDVVEQGNGYTNAEVIFNDGGSGTGASATANITNGEVTAITLNNPGSGYNRTLTGSVSGDGQGARIRVVIGEPDSTQIRLMENDYSINNIKFVGVSIEGDNVDRHVWCEGSHILFDQCRWEANVPNAHFVRNVTPNSGSENKIIVGHGSPNIFISVAGGGTKRNYVDRSSRGINIESFNQALRLRSTNGTSVFRVYGSVTNFMNRGITSQFDNQWSVDIGDFGYRGKHRDDLHSKIILDNNTGRLSLGDGSIETPPVILSGAGSPEGVVSAPIGSIYMNRLGSGGATLRNIWEKTASAGNTGWRLIGLQPNATTTSRGIVLQLLNIANITTADATDETEAIALVNEIKAKLNSILTEMKSRGTMVPDTP